MKLVQYVVHNKVGRGRHAAGSAVVHTDGVKVGIEGDVSA
jgi:hypothetical protein